MRRRDTVRCVIEEDRDCAPLRSPSAPESPTMRSARPPTRSFPALPRSRPATPRPRSIRPAPQSISSPTPSLPLPTLAPPASPSVASSTPPTPRPRAKTIRPRAKTIRPALLGTSPLGPWRHSFALVAFHATAQSRRPTGEALPGRGTHSPDGPAGRAGRWDSTSRHEIKWLSMLARRPNGFSLFFAASA